MQRNPLQSALTWVGLDSFPKGTETKFNFDTMSGTHVFKGRVTQDVQTLPTSFSVV